MTKVPDQPTSPHPERGCDQDCDITDDAHGGGVVWFAPGASAATESEVLRLALLDGAPGDLTGAAITLLTDIPGAIYTAPAFQRYLGQAPEGAFTVDWVKLGTDLLAGNDGLPMAAQDRALLLLAVSIGADHAVRVALGALLQHLEGDRLSLLIGALQHAGGVW